MNIRTSAFRGLAILSLTALGMAACEDKDVINIPETPPPPVEVTVAPTQVELMVGQQAALAAVVKNSTNQSVTWACAPSGVVTLSGTTITAAAPGAAVCTATAAADANAKGVVSVTVRAAPTPPITLSVLPTTATINSVAPGNTIQLQATVSGSTNQNVTWGTSASGVATVSTTGLVTAVAPGTAVITATSAADATVKTSSVITVVAPQVPVVGITVSPTAANTTIGGTVQLVPIVTGSTNTNVTYRSSTPAVATVSTSGLVTGVTGGTAVITAIAAADTTKKATSVITVAGAPPAASISIASVVQHDEGSPVDPNDIEEQIDVTVNVSAVPENDVRAVVVYVDDIQVCRQNFSTPLGTTQGVATINCPVNTAEVLMPGYDPKFMNGEHEISAKALNGAGEEITTATFCPIGAPCKVIFDNEDFVAKVTATFENTVGDWHSGIVTAHVEFVKYTLEDLSEFTAWFESECDVNNNPDLSGYTQDLTFANGEWTAEFEVDDATFDDACVAAGVWEYENGEDGNDWVHSATFQYDTEAPYIDDMSSVGSNVYYNDAKTFSADVDDYGVGGEDAFTKMWFFTVPGGAVAEEGPAGTASIMTDGLAETPQNVGYTLKVSVADALGNTAVYGGFGNFGIDFTEPTVEYTVQYDGTTYESDELADMPIVVNTMATGIIFDFQYIDYATPPAGPSGFNANPVSYTIHRYNGANGASVAGTPVSPVANSFELPLTGTDGYYRVRATVTDAAGNVWTMPEFVILVDDTPPAIGALTVPTILNGGQPFTMSAQLADNVDLGEGWAVIGYSNGGIAPYWVIQTKEELDTYGYASLNKSDVFGEITIPSVIRSITTTDAAGRPLGTATAYTAHVAEYVILDVAGVELGGICPLAEIPLDFAAEAFTTNCRLRRANIAPAYAIANPTVRNWQTVNSGLSGIYLNNNAGLGTLSAFLMNTTSAAVDATITGPFQTFLNPFPNGVKFYGIDPYGRAHLLGTGSVGVFDDTNLVTRTWTYTLRSSWPGDYDELYPGGVFAMGVANNGDALVTLVEGAVPPPMPGE